MSPRPSIGLAVALAAMLATAPSCRPALHPPRRVVLVTWDTTRADRLGAYGYEHANTPNLDALARAGVVFENAVSPVPTTLPSHSTMFTGLYPQDHKVRYNLQFRLSEELQTLAERLRAAGYATAGFPASHILGKKYGIAQGFDHWSDPPAPEPGAGVHPEAVMRSAANGVDEALAWIEGARGRLFLWLHFYDPHHPYTPPFPFDSQYRDNPYDGELAYTDKQFGRLMEALQADEAWRDTLVIVAGDHGEGLHDHRERWHSLLVYDSTQHVPLILGGAGLPAGRRVAEPVTLADVTPTILDLAGIPAADRLRGVSLRRALTAGAPPPRDIYFESLAGSLNYGWQELTGIRFGTWKLIRSESPELYDLKADPGELRDLAGLEGARLQELQAQLDKILEPIADVEQVEVSETLSQEEIDLLTSLGYGPGGVGGSVAGAPHPRDLVDLQMELLSAQSMVARQEWVRVEEFVDYVLTRDPKNKWAMMSRANALLQQDKLEEAERAAAEAYRVHPDDPAMPAVFARSLSARAKFDEACRIMETAVAREGFTTHPRLRYLLLVTAFEAERSNVCTDLVPAAVIDFPMSGLVQMMKARCIARDGDAPGALERLRTAAAFGFREVGVLEHAPEFAAVLELPEYAAFAASLENEDDGDDNPAAPPPS